MFCDIPLYRSSEMYKKIIFIILSISFIFSNNEIYGIHPSLQSVFIPGWGQTTLKNKKHANTFISIEFALWTAYLGSYTFSKHQKNQYQSFAANHASVNPKNKNHNYWVDIGNYIDIDHHNEEHLRWRNFDQLYAEEDSWYWDSNHNMEKFENMRINSDLMKKNCKYILGAIPLNHIISAIDSLYLLRSLEGNKITFSPFFGKQQTGLRLLIEL